MTLEELARLEAFMRERGIEEYEADGVRLKLGPRPQSSTTPDEAVRAKRAKLAAHDRMEHVRKTAFAHSRVRPRGRAPLETDD